MALTFIGSAATGGALGFGWAKPTPVNPMNLEGGRRGEALVAAAGPLSNFVLAALGALPLRYLLDNPQIVDIDSMVILVLFYFVQINLLLMIFNFIPIRRSTARRCCSPWWTAGRSTRSGHSWSSTGSSSCSRSCLSARKLDRFADHQPDP